MRPAMRRASFDFLRSPWRSPMAMRRCGEGRRVGSGGGGDDGGGRRKKPLTEKSTNVSMNEEKRLGICLQNEFSFSISISNRFKIQKMAL